MAANNLERRILRHQLDVDAEFEIKADRAGSEPLTVRQIEMRRGHSAYPWFSPKRNLELPFVRLQAAAEVAQHQPLERMSRVVLISMSLEYEAIGAGAFSAIEERAE